MATRYWDVREERGLLVCTCPKCRIEKSIMRIGKYRTAKCMFCHTPLRYRQSDRKRFDKGSNWKRS